MCFPEGQIANILEESCRRGTCKAGPSFSVFHASPPRKLTVSDFAMRRLERHLLACFDSLGCTTSGDYKWLNGGVEPAEVVSANGDRVSRQIPRFRRTYRSQQ